ncbi:hypothetical protein I3842_02G044800 [Carya illinoinensis]|uniref:DUF4371 domain-containing protein n=1 Tax=Carya illinoinensis TaxID=32201 RepID=A0A922K3L5_CARIL|nr:hypothetical protein I3842_02G044800 [Carya illinoinensis]
MMLPLLVLVNCLFFFLSFGFESSVTTERDTSTTDKRPSKTSRIQPEEIDVTSLERDPGLHEIRRAYLKTGPYQPKLSEYPFSGIGNQHRQFQFSWFQRYSNWLEYLPSKNAIFCLPCYIFAKKSTRYPGSNAFTNKVEKQVSQEMENNRLQLKTSIESVRWLTFQACAFRGHDERFDSKNQGNFIELIKLLASYNDQVNRIVMENAPQNAKYTSPKIQKEILHIFANKVYYGTNSKKWICALLSRYDLQIENIRGQGYEGRSNMHGEWNGLQALFLKYYPYAYYVHFINTISNEGSNYSQRGDAEAAYMVLTSFEFILILHMMKKKIMGITNAPCQSLQQNFQDIVNTISLVSTTKVIIQNLRDDGWESLLTDLQELNNRFKYHTMALLILSAALNPKGAYKSFKIDDICKLVEKFYLQYFIEQEKFILRIQLQHYELDMSTHLDFQDMSTLSELCRGLAISKKLRTRMEDKFLADHLLVYIEKEIAKNLTSEMIMDEFYSMKDRRRA